MINRTDARTSKRGYPQVRALCCECGNVRTTSTYAAYGEPAPATADRLAALGYEPTRCTVSRKCAVCRKQTTHAYLRDDLSPEDRQRRERSLSDALSPVVTEMVEMLEECEVRVWWKPEEDWHPRQVALIRQWLDDNTWHVELNEAANVVHLAGALEGAWLLMAEARDDLGGDGWRSVAGDPDDPAYPPYRYRVFHVPAV